MNIQILGVHVQDVGVCMYSILAGWVLAMISFSGLSQQESLHYDYYVYHPPEKRTLNSQ